MPESDLLKKEKPTGKRKRIFWIIIFVFIIGAVSSIYIGYKKIDIRSMKLFNFDVKSVVSKSFLAADPEKEESGIAEIKYDSNIIPQFDVYKDYIIKCEHDNLSFLDKSGETKISFPIKMSNPVIKRSGAYFVVADIGGKGLVVFNEKEKKLEKELADNILNIDISSNGYLAVVHEQKRYKGAVSFLNPQGVVQFTSVKAENFILAAKISETGKYLTLSIMDVSGIKVNPIFEFMDSFGQLLSSDIPTEQALFPSLWYMYGEAIVAIGDSQIVYYNNDRERKWIKNTDGRVLSSGVIQNKYIVAALVSKSNSTINTLNKTDIVIYNTKGKENGKYIIDDGVRNINTYEGIIAVNTGREVYFINSGGKLISKYKSKKDIATVKFFSTKEALVITKSNIVVIKI